MGRGEHAGTSMDGQMTFSSGWEWGYWLQEVVTARAAWDPKADLDSDEDAMVALLEPLERVFGDAGEPLLAWIVDYTRAQQELLIDGTVAGNKPGEVERRNGQAYLQGFETWDDVSDFAADSLGMTHGRMQPERVGLVEMRDGSFDRAEYDENVAPLLEEMDVRFGRLDKRLEELREDVPANALRLYEDLVDSSRITALRARQMRGLYAFVDAQENGDNEELAQAYLETAQEALDEALSVVAHREKHYRTPADRVAGWRENPTVYPFTYLWTVRSLYYWQRDEAKAVAAWGNPCLYNIIDPVDVTMGKGLVSGWVGRLGEEMARVPALRRSAACMAAPAEEPQFLPVSWHPTSE